MRSCTLLLEKGPNPADATRLPLSPPIITFYAFSFLALCVQSLHVVLDVYRKRSGSSGVSRERLFSSTSGLQGLSCNNAKEGSNRPKE